MPKSVAARLFLLIAFMAAVSLVRAAFTPWWQVDIPPNWLTFWLTAPVVGGIFLAMAIRLNRGYELVAPKAQSTPLCPISTIGHIPPLRKIPVRPLVIVSLAESFGLIAALFLMCIMFVLMILRTPQMPFGLAVSFRRTEFATPVGTTSPDSLGVYIDATNHIYVNGKPVAREMLPISLKEELSHHATTTIYFEAADNSGYGQCIYAIDTIRGLRADLILITPGMRDEWKRTAHQ